MNIILPTGFEWVQLNPDLEKVLHYLYNTKENLNIIGPAGTGKSTILKMIASDTKHFGNIVVLASTGVSAVNISSEGIKGSTIHSFFKIPPYTMYSHNNCKTHEDLIPVIQNIDTILIDEISMVNASLFDFIFELLIAYNLKTGKETLPRVILFGDILQLPPVINNKDDSVKKYFNILYNDNVMYFNARAFSDYHFKTIHLNTIYRQSDTSFQNILNRIRLGTYTDTDLAIINDHVIPEIDFYSQNEMFLYLCAYNKKVDDINTMELEINPNRQKDYIANISGNIDPEILNTIPKVISLKNGLQIMCLRNDNEKQYVNGTMGIVERMYDNYVEVRLPNNDIIEVVRYDWDIYNYTVEHNTTQNVNKVDTNSVSVIPSRVGVINQLAVKGAKAISIHKSQGKTLDIAYIDFGFKAFAPSMVYVGLSRLTSLEGLGLFRKIKKSDIMLNYEALNFLETI